MANRRMLSKSISVSKQVNSLSDRAALLFTWMIPHADDWGRMKAEPSVIRALVVPMRRGFSNNVVEVCLQEITSAGLISVYNVNGDAFLFFPHWDQHQGALVTARRTESNFPEPPADALQCNEVPCQPNLTKPNLTKPSMGPTKATTTKECSWCKPPPESESDMQSLMRAYHDGYKCNNSRCPVGFEGQAAKTFGELLRRVDAGDIHDAVANLFLSTDVWIVEHAYPVTKVRSDFNALREHPLHPVGKAKERKSTW